MYAPHNNNNNEPIPNCHGSGAGNPPAQEQGKRLNRNCRGGGKRETHFEGKCDALMDVMYDVVTGKDTFMQTTQVCAGRLRRKSAAFSTERETYSSHNTRMSITNHIVLIL